MTAGWNPAAGTDTTGPSPYDYTYSWIAGATAPNLQNATAVDNSGNSSTVGFTILADAGVPTGGTLSVVNGLTGAASTPVAFASGSDAGSGLATTQLQRQQAAYSAGACGVYSPMADIGPVNPASPYNDATIADGILLPVPDDRH